MRVKKRKSPGGEVAIGNHRGPWVMQAKKAGKVQYGNYSSIFHMPAYTLIDKTDTLVLRVKS